MTIGILIPLALLIALGISYIPNRNPRIGLIIIILSFTVIISIIGFNNISLWVLPPIIIGSGVLGWYISNKDTQKERSILEIPKVEKFKTEIVRESRKLDNLSDEELTKELIKRGLVMSKGDN